MFYYSRERGGAHVEERVGRAGHDDYLVGYNQRRPHQGRGMKSRDPAHAFNEGLPRKAKPQQPKEPKATPESQAEHPAI